MRKYGILFVLIISFITLFSFKIDVYADLKDDVKSNSCEDLIQKGIIDKSNASLLFDPPYDVNCIYYRTVSGGVMWRKKACQIFQISYSSSDGNLKHEALLPFFDLFGKVTFFNNDYALINEDIISEFRGMCPLNVSAERSSDSLDVAKVGIDIKSKDGGNMTRMYSTSIDVDFPSLIIDKDCDKLTGEEKEKCLASIVDSCESAFGGEKGVNFLKGLFLVIRIFIPIILFAFGCLDFAKAIFSQNEDTMQKAQFRFIQRVIIAVVIFLIPIILKLILQIAHSIWPVVSEDLCGLL